MKYIISMFLIFSQVAFASNKQYLVTTHHPHDLDELQKYTKIIKSNGRTLLVKINNEEDFPKHLRSIIREVSNDEILNYVPSNKNFSNKNSVVESLLKNVTPEEMKRIVTKVSDFTNRKSGSEDNLKASRYIENEFKKMSLKTEFDCFRAKTCNIYGRYTGTTKPNEIILIEAHLDSVGRANAGADDNASGVAGLLMIAKEVLSTNPKTSFIFFATNGEEQGLRGAKHYVNVLKKSGELKKVKFVINMDMIGYNKDNDKVDLETNKPFVDTAKWMSDLVYTYTNLTPNIVTPAWGSDHVPFLKEGIPTLLTIEHWPSKNPCYHRGCDKPDHLTYEYGAEIIKLNIAAAYLKSEE